MRASAVKRDARGGTAFGYALRSARLLFHWHDGLRAYMRITGIGDGRWKVELSDGPSLPTACSKEERTLWWESDGDPVDLSPALAEIRSSLRSERLVGFRSLLLNDDGEVVAKALGA